MGRSRTGKSERVLQRIAALGDSSQQILLVPEHASHVAEMDLCRVCGDTASRHAEALTFKLLASRVLGICGGSAIAAVAPVIDADENQTSLSLATIFILNAVALFVFPVIGHWLGMGQTQFGTWAAIAIHDTSSVVGAGAAYGEEALKVATTVKLTRALWIIPLSLVSALIFRQKGKKIQIPWFIFWFIVAMLVNTYCNLPTQLTHGISVAARCGLSATLFLIGGGLSIEVIRKVGLKPLVLGIILWAVISVASLAVILLL